MTSSYDICIYRCLDIKYSSAENQMYATIHFIYSFIIRRLIFQLKRKEAYDSLCSLMTT
jgi:hypothetical protein